MSICGCDHCECWCEDCKELEVYEGPITPEEYRRGKMLQEIYREALKRQLTEPIEFKRFRSEESNE